ncbi:hypothetical protein COCSUDRAFT_33014, partial [Coccomyxa subellipsoidea C-169]
AHVSYAAKTDAWNLPAFCSPVFLLSECKMGYVFGWNLSNMNNFARHAMQQSTILYSFPDNYLQLVLDPNGVGLGVWS